MVIIAAFTFAGVPFAAVLNALAAFFHCVLLNFAGDPSELKSGPSRVTCSHRAASVAFDTEASAAGASLARAPRVITPAPSILNDRMGTAPPAVLLSRAPLLR